MTPEMECPFCLVSVVEIVSSSLPVAEGVQAECGYCGARGPIHDTEEEAMAGWNRSLRVARQMVGQSVFESYEEYPKAMASIRRGLAGEESSADVEVAGLRWDTRCISQHDERGEITGLTDTPLDVTEQKRVADALAEIIEQEQERIRRDLHDSVGQDLTGLSGMARSLSNKLHKLSLPEAERADEIVRGVQQTLDDVQRAINGLGPIQMGPLGLMLALEKLVNTTQDQLDVDIRFVCKGQVAIENKSSATHLYRIAQEAINNALKHSNAEHITVSLVEKNSQLSLEIRDDGVGIGEEAKYSEGMGLHILLYRARALGSELSIDSPDGAGTRIRCTYGMAGSLRCDERHSVGSA